MAQQQPPRYFLAVLLAILVLAGSLRFASLGAASLNEYEATAALAALEPSEGLGDQPGYALLTTPLFFILNSSETLARFWPALFGLALVALPALWRDRLGDKAVLALSFILAIDPGMVALSRLASGRMIAISAALIALIAWLLRKPLVAGIFVIVAALAAGTVYFGFGAATLTWLLVRPKLSLDRGQIRTAGIGALTTLAIGGTLLFTLPQGFGALGSSLQGFLVPAQPGVSLATILFALVGYGLPLLIFGGAGAIRALKTSAPDRRLLPAFALAALVLILLHPARQVADLAWVLLPLAVLAAQEISIHLHAPDHEPAAAYGGLGLLLLLSTFMVFTLARSANEPTLVIFTAGSFIPWVAPGLWISTFVLLVAGVVVVLIALGWSSRASALAIVWTAALLFAAFLLSASTRFTRPDANIANELWSPGPAAGTLHLMQATVDDLSFWQQGQPNAVAVDLRRHTASLHWVLRALPPSAQAGSPSLAVTSSEALPQEFASYRGQSFALSSQPAWSGWPPNYFAWLLFRNAPVQTDHVILWVSPDLFLDNGFTQTP
jgi:hypothetical protein